ncbi:MAG: hypothetical protein F6K09_00080 [Merismopedia sp. SIO2A8]|nr:hypothetical protein [Merismopedia sp. SIO2A8]
MNNTDEIQRRINQKIDSATVAYMNDSKWRKLFDALRNYAGNINGMQLKFVHDERILPTFGVPGPYEEHEVGLGDEMPAPYAPFREIEFLLIPKKCQHPNTDQNRALPDLQNDLFPLKKHLDKIAKFPIQFCEDGSIKILGYSWSS